MTKQEEIWEGIDRIIRHWSGGSISEDWMPLYGGYNASQDIVLYLVSEGVVIKVFHEGELKVEHSKHSVGWYDYEPLIGK